MRVCCSMISEIHTRYGSRPERCDWPPRRRGFARHGNSRRCSRYQPSIRFCNVASDRVRKCRVWRIGEPYCRILRGHDRPLREFTSSGIWPRCVPQAKKRWRRSTEAKPSSRTMQCLQRVNKEDVRRRPKCRWNRMLRSSRENDFESLVFASEIVKKCPAT